MLVCAFFRTFCTRDRGCSAHPAFPAPSCFRGTTYFAKLGQTVSRERGCVIKIESGLTTSLRGALLSAEARLRAKADATRHPLFPSSSRRTPGPIRRAVAFGQFVRDLLQQQTTGIMGPGVRRDDGICCRILPNT